MNNLSKIGFVFGLVVLLASCKSDNAPNYQYFPQMYEPVGYETYGKVNFLPDGKAAMVPPAENTIPRGWMPYANLYTNMTRKARELARPESKSVGFITIWTMNLATGQATFMTIYCAICHGDTRCNGQGNTG